MQDLDFIEDRLDVFAGGGRTSQGFVGKSADADDSVTGCLLLGGGEGVLLGVEACVLLGKIVRHVGECAGGLGSLPAEVIDVDEAESDGGVVIAGVFSVGDEVAEDADVLIDGGLAFVDIVEDGAHAVGVAFDLGVEAGFGVVNEVAVVLPLDEAFEGECD